MRRTPAAVALGVGLGVLLAGCRNDSLPLVGRSPTAPTPAPAPVEPRFPDDWAGDQYVVKLTLMSVEGPVQCWVGAIGRSFEWWMAVERSDGSIRLQIGVDQDSLEFTGTLTGTHFKLRRPGYDSGSHCLEPGNTTAVRFRSDSEVSGYFREDFTTLTATELVTNRLYGSGETIVLRWAWEAKKR